MRKTLSYEPIDEDSSFRGVIMVDKIVRLSKSDDGEVTYVHLINGEKIATLDSINTIEARLNSNDYY
jgi:hypothetical protein